MRFKMFIDMKKQVLISVLVICLTINTISCDLIKPCFCEDNNIFCKNERNIDLVKIFENFENNLNKSEKHFKSINLGNIGITEIKANTFKELSFDKIEISQCTFLKHIDENAFPKTQNVTTAIEFANNPALNNSPDNSIFNLLNKFMNLKEIQLIFNNISEIPSNAFGKFDQLAHVSLAGNTIKKLGNNSFSKLHNLIELFITQTSIDYIPDNAFNFVDQSDKVLELRLFLNHQLNSSSFAKSSLSKLNKPTVIELDQLGDQFKYLDENVFGPFFALNAQNKISLDQDPMDCNDCRNYWLQNRTIIGGSKNTNYLSRLENLKCQDGKNFTESDHLDVNCRLKQFTDQCYFGGFDSLIVWPGEIPLISCGGNKYLDLPGLFKNFTKFLNKNDRKFQRFRLNNTAIEVLEENIFYDMSFEEIFIENCNNLKTIHRNAFAATESETTSLYIRVSPNLSSNDNSIFEVLSRFPKIKGISISYTNISEIPSNAFKTLNSHQDKLNYLRFDGCSFKKLGTRAFSNLKNLTLVTFFSTCFEKVPEFAFSYEEQSTIPLEIVFGGNVIVNSTWLNEKSLVNIKRPTTVKIEWSATKLYKYLDEKVLLPFLLDNKNNFIDIPNNLIDCNDCRHYWLKKHNLSSRIKIGIKCSGGKQFNDPDNFKNCSSLYTFELNF